MTNQLYTLFTPYGNQWLITIEFSRDNSRYHAYIRLVTGTGHREVVTLTREFEFDTPLETFGAATAAIFAYEAEDN